MKKPLLRILTFALSLLLLLSLSACGNQADETPEITVPDEYTRYISPWTEDVVAQAKSSGTMEFYFMSDLGSTKPAKWGDSCLIVFPNGETMLVDAGSAEHGNLLIWNLKRMGITRLDYILISHDHDDHHFGVSKTALLDEFEVGKLYYNQIYHSGWHDTRHLEGPVEERSIPYEPLAAGDVLTFGDVRMEVLWPAQETKGTSVHNNDDLNKLSMVVRFDYGETSALFTGDIYVQTEEHLADVCSEKLDVDLLKLPHHGALTSNSEALANATTPQISVGSGYQAVSALVYSRYTSVGSKVLLDFCDGYIHVTSDGTQLQYETSQERTTNIYAGYEQ